MADIVAPNFSPFWLSPAWIKARWHPDMTNGSEVAIISILEIGLLFREDSLQLEDALQERVVLVGRRSRLPHVTRGERVAAVVAIGACVAVLPLKFPLSCRANLARLGMWAVAGVSVPLMRGLLRPRTLPALLAALQTYAGLARRALTCVRDGSLQTRHCKSAAEGLGRALVAQQQQLCGNLRNACTALAPACPWLPPAWDLLPQTTQDLMKIHHLFLLLQSSFLKTVALAHLSPSRHVTRLYKNHNERLHWIHAELLPYILEPLLHHIVDIETCLRNYKEVCNFKDAKFLPKAYNANRDAWQYSEVHVGVSSLSTELLGTLVKCNEMDSFLEACWAAKSKFSPEILEDDLSKIKDELVKCFNTIENTSVKLKKIRVAEMKLLEAAVQKLPLPAVEEQEEDVNSNVKVVSEETPVEIQDQVYYYEKTDENGALNDVKVVDYLTGPGKKEIQATKAVLGELRVKLVKREEEMREREARALENTMPELKGKIPEFPRQMGENNHGKEMVVINGEGDSSTSSSKVETSLDSNGDKLKDYVDNVAYENELFDKVLNEGKKESRTDFNTDLISHEQSCSKLINKEKVPESIAEGSTELSSKDDSSVFEKDIEFVKSSNCEQSSDVEDLLKVESKDSIQVSSPIHKPVELNNSEPLEKDKPKIEHFESYDADTSDAESDFDKSALLKDLRKHRVTRKKNHPPSRKGSLRIGGDRPDGVPPGVNGAEEADEGSKPVEYSFGTGMAMASLLQIQGNNSGAAAFPKLLMSEETFIGDGEVSEDSGNED